MQVTAVVILFVGLLFVWVLFLFSFPTFSRKQLLIFTLLYFK